MSSESYDYLVAMIRRVIYSDKPTKQELKLANKHSYNIICKLKQSQKGIAMIRHVYMHDVYDYLFEVAGQGHA